LTSRLCSRAVGVESPRAHSFAPVGLLSGYADVGACQRQKAAERSSELARGDSKPLGGLFASPDQLLHTAIEGRGDKLE